jgi:hypothetical protein
VANPCRLVVSRGASVAVINILDFWAAVATAIYSRFSPVWGDGLIDGFSWDAGVCGGAMPLCTLTLVGESRFLCERAGLGVRGGVVTCCVFLSPRKGLQGL